MMLIFLATVVAEPQPPRTVNGDVIGTAERFRRVGPQAICLESTRITLEKGETSELDYLGIHSGRVRIVTTDGAVTVSEGDAWVTPKRSQRAYDTVGGYIERVGRGKKARYLIFAPSDYSSQPTPRVWVDGSAFRGTEADRDILDRIEVTKGPPKDCDQRFDYGWDFILGEPSD